MNKQNEFPTLVEYIFYLFENKLTKTKDFEVLIEWYGREKLMKIWDEYKEKLKGKK